jgi:hypothetical protein
MKGYHREANLRKDGSKADVYYHTPTGQRLRSSVDASNYIDASRLRNKGNKDLVLPAVDDFDFSSPKVSDLRLYPKLDYNRLKDKLDEIYERIGDGGRAEYEKLAGEDMERFQKEFAEYKMWRQVKTYLDKAGDFEDDANGDSRRSGRKRRKVSQTPVSYLTSKSMSAYDLTTKAIRDYPRTSTILDIERHVFLGDLVGAEAMKTNGSMYDGQNLVTIRNTLGTLLREGRVKRVFANLHKTDHHHLFHAAMLSKPESLEELQMKKYECQLKRTEAVLRRIILGILQISPEMLSASCELQEMSPEERSGVKPEEWKDSGHSLLGMKLWRSDGLQAEVVSWIPEIEYRGGGAEMKAGGVGGVGGGRLVTRRAMFKCKVTNAGEFYAPPVVQSSTLTAEEAAAAADEAEMDRTEWILTEFQVLGYGDALELKLERDRHNEELYEAGVPTANYMGRALQVAESIYTTKKGGSVAKTKDLQWVTASCVAVGPSDNKMLLLGDNCTEGFWGRYFPQTKSFIREGDDESRATPVKWEGSTASFEAASSLLEFLAAQPESYLFMEPVDPVFYNIPDYPLVIRNPMDFGTIKKKLAAREYHEIDGERVDLRGSFRRDVELVFANALLFNGENSQVGAVTKKLQKRWLRKFPLVVDRIDKQQRRQGVGGFDAQEGYGDDDDDYAEDDEMADVPIEKLKVRSVGVENAFRLSDIVEALPVKSEAEKFSTPDEFNVFRNSSKSGLGYVSRLDPSVTSTDRVDLESAREQHHKALAQLYVKFVGCGGGKEEKVKESRKKPSHHTVSSEDYEAEKAAIAAQERREEERKKEEAEAKRLARSYQHDFAPWLGSISYVTGELTWEIRKPHLLPALRYVLRGLIQSGHVFEVESIAASKASTGGGTVCVANAYMPSLPHSVIKVKANHRKKKEAWEEEGEEEEVELSDYEKARAERVARNNAYLKTLGLA